MIRLKEAIEYARQNGVVFRKKDLARELWPDSPAKSAYMNFLNVEKGKTRKIDDEIIRKLCARLGVTADYLYGRTDTPNAEREMEEVKQAVCVMADTIKATINNI